jgi:hypothetical protein
MDPHVKERLSLKDALRTAGFILILLLFPYPLGFLLALGVPLGWPYLATYAGWVVFVFLLTWYGFRSSGVRRSRWPHRRLMYLSLGGLFLWYILKSTVLKVGNAVDWFVFIALAVWLLVEATFVVRDQRARRA